MKKIFLLLIIILFSGCIHEQTEQLYVIKVIDGDTFILSNGDHIRLIGVNTPEKGEYYYQEAKNALKDLILNKQIILKSDISTKDRYGRYLKYVYVDNIFVNLYLVKNGYARTYIIEPNVKYSKDFIDAEKYAKSQKIGIWE